MTIIMARDSSPQHVSSINPDDIDSVAPLPPTEEKIQEYLEARAAKDEEVFQTVKMQVEKAQERQKKQYWSRIKRGTKCFRIEVGMEVLKKNEWKTGRLGSKLEQNWLGPHRCLVLASRRLVLALRGVSASALGAALRRLVQRFRVWDSVLNALCSMLDTSTLDVRTSTLGALTLGARRFDARFSAI
ncbi:UNVERIFIED_CONTAM: hypothetical protein FKN15_020054 [Acipenser sinensis]